MQDLINFLKEFISNKLPPWAKILVSFLIAAVSALVVFFSLVGCGSTTRATVKHSNDSSTVNISITTSNPSEIVISPETSVSTDTSRFNFRFNNPSLK